MLCSLKHESEGTNCLYLCCSVIWSRAQRECTWKVGCVEFKGGRERYLEALSNLEATKREPDREGLVGSWKEGDSVSI